MIDFFFYLSIGIKQLALSPMIDWNFKAPRKNISLLLYTDNVEHLTVGQILIHDIWIYQEGVKGLISIFRYATRE
jgi:hypothetical protein